MTIVQVADQLAGQVYQWAGLILAGAVGLVVMKLSLRALLTSRIRGMPARRDRAHLGPDVEFRRKALLNRAETKVFRTIRPLLGETFGTGAQLLAQASYGAFLEGRTESANKAINSRRADFVVVGEDLDVLCVIEYQGTGHFGSTWRSSERARNGDGIKRSALKSAGIPLIELPAEADARTIKAALEKAVGERARTIGERTAGVGARVEPMAPSANLSPAWAKGRPQPGAVALDASDQGRMR